MNHYRIALFTPLHPLKSGISDYIEEMLPYLRQSFGDKYTIDIFVDGFEPDSQYIKDNYKILEMDDFEACRDNYDLVIYQMGNNNFHLKIMDYAMRYPGLLVMHDFAIHHLVAYYYLDRMKSDTAYFQAVEDNHGQAARDIAYQRAAKGELGLWETDAIDYPMNRVLVQRSLGAIIFSEFSKQRLLKYGDHVPIHRVYLHCSGKARRITPDEKEKACKKLGVKLEKGERLICVFGFIGRAKRPYSILEAARRLREAGEKFRIVYVGQLQDDCKDLPGRIRDEGLKGIASITGFTTAEEFDLYVQAADICISLRYPTMGETSGVLMRALRYGKPSIVTDIGTFCEFPDDTVIKIGHGDTEVDELTYELKRLLSDDDLNESLASNGVKYAEEHLEPQKTAQSFVDFAKELIAFEKIRKNPEYIAARDELLKAVPEDDRTIERYARKLSDMFKESEEIL